MTPRTVEIACATKRYGRKLAVDGVSFQVRAGTAAVLVGPNGAGKSTLLNAALGRVRLDAGSAGVQPGDGAIVGAILEDTSPEPYVSVGELLRWRELVVGVRERSREAAQKLVGLHVEPRRRFRDLSRGQRQLALWAAALIGPPDALLLDEPMVHLDPLQRAACRKRIAAERDRGAAVLLSTHVLTEIDATWMDRALILVEGRLVAEHRPEDDIAGALAEHVGASLAT